jgi:hypothetical protein
LGQRRDLALENLALRHQLTVLKRQSKKPQLEDRDRLFWIGMKRFWAGWSGAGSTIDTVASSLPDPDLH